VKDRADDQGRIEKKIPLKCSQAQLKVWPDANNKNCVKYYQLGIGELDSPNDVSGIQQRLNNLAYDAGLVDDDYGSVTHRALCQAKANPPDEKTEDLHHFS